MNMVCVILLFDSDRHALNIKSKQNNYVSYSLFSSCVAVETILENHFDFSCSVFEAWASETSGWPGKFETTKMWNPDSLHSRVGGYGK